MSSATTKKRKYPKLGYQTPFSYVAANERLKALGKMARAIAPTFDWLEDPATASNATIRVECQCARIVGGYIDEVRKVSKLNHQATASWYRLAEMTTLDARRCRWIAKNWPRVERALTNWGAEDRERLAAMIVKGG